MIEVYPRLFVGSQEDYEWRVARQPGWAVVHACKDPYHRQALGYQSKGAPQGDPEYFVARRGNRLMLNIVDAPRPELFNKDRLIDPALAFLDEMWATENQILVHCNQGESRGPSVALLYMATRLRVLPNATVEAAEARFRELYPGYAPKPGIRGHLLAHWEEYRAGEERSNGGNLQG